MKTGELQDAGTDAEVLTLIVLLYFSHLVPGRSEDR